MQKLEWTDKLSVNISVFDNEHKKLIGIINRLYDAMSQGLGHKAMAGILVELSDYTKTHFEHEEDAMKRHDYPGFAEQKKAHDEFVNKLNDTRTQYENGGITLSIPLFKLLLSWVENHIMKIDQKYSEFFIERGMK